MHRNSTVCALCKSMTVQCSEEKQLFRKVYVQSKQAKVEGISCLKERERLSPEEVLTNMLRKEKRINYCSSKDTTQSLNPMSQKVLELDSIGVISPCSINSRCTDQILKLIHEHKKGEKIHTAAFMGISADIFDLSVSKGKSSAWLEKKRKKRQILK